MKSVLVIEDDTLLRAGVAEILELEGYKVLAAEDGEEGVTLALQETPNLILCDVGLPYLDGYGVLRQLRTNPNTQAIPFLFMTALTDIKQVIQSAGVSRDQIILKPFDVDQMLSTLRDCLP